jgi:hypothetical protein
MGLTGRLAAINKCPVSALSRHRRLRGLATGDAPNETFPARSGNGALGVEFGGTGQQA